MVSKDRKSGKKYLATIQFSFQSSKNKNNLKVLLRCKAEFICNKVWLRGDARGPYSCHSQKKRKRKGKSLPERY